MRQGDTILLTGATGQIGFELARVLAPAGRIVAPTREQLDLRDIDAIRAFVRDVRPTLIVNAAGYTAVDRAEAEPDLCAQLNAHAPTVLAEEARRLDAGIIHYSTDYVFDGRQQGRYLETDRPNPLSVYGQTKLDGELGVAGAGARHLILRTSWVYGTRGHNFMLTILRLAREHAELRVVSDQIGAPTWSRSIASATGHIVTALLGNRRDLWNQPQSVYHLAAAGETSWHGFAEAIVAEVRDRASLVCRRITPITTPEYPTPAARPANSRLDLSAIDNAFGVSLADWRTDLRLAMAEVS